MFVTEALTSTQQVTARHVASDITASNHHHHHDCEGSDSSSGCSCGCSLAGKAILETEIFAQLKETARGLGTQQLNILKLEESFSVRERQKQEGNVRAKE